MSLGPKVVNLFLLGAFGAFLWSAAMAEISPASPISPKDKAADAISKTHQNKVSAPSSNGAHDNPPLTSTGPAAENGHSANDHGLGVLVGQHQDEQHQVNACVHDTQLSTGTTSTVDVHGDNLIHLSTEPSRAENNSGAAHDEHDHASMTVHEVKQVLNDLVSTAGTVEAQEVNLLSGGYAVLHDGSTQQSIDVTKSSNHEQQTGNIPREGTDVTRHNAPEENSVIIPSTTVVTPTSATTEITQPIQTAPVITDNPAPAIVVAPAPTPTTTTTPTEVVTTPVAPDAISESQQSTPSNTSVQTTPEIPTPVVTEQALQINPIDNPVPSTVANNVSTTSQTPSLPVSNLVPTEIPPTPPTVSPVETVTHSIQPTVLDSSSRSVSVTGMQTIDLNSSDVSANIFTSAVPEVGTLTSSRNTLITVGQVLSKTGNVAEIDQDGIAHPLEVGKNVHLGGRFAFTGNTGNLVIRSFTGEIIHIGQ